jgi:hypothetical protein
MTTIHIYNRGEIMRDAWRKARQQREEVARRAHATGARIVGSRIIYARPFEDVLAETPLDLASAMKEAWADAKRDRASYDLTERSGQLIIAAAAWRSGALAPMRRRLRSIRVLPLLLRLARFASQNFIRSRAA